MPPPIPINAENTPIVVPIRPLLTGCLGNALASMIFLGSIILIATITATVPNTSVKVLDARYRDDQPPIAAPSAMMGAQRLNKAISIAPLA